MPDRIVPFPSGVDRALIDKYSGALPRYTSYPTVPHFLSTFDEKQYFAAHRRSMVARSPLGLYLHLPFCRSLCTYCACNRKITQSRDTIRRYLDYLKREIGLISPQIGRPVGRIHWGGGTPTYLTETEARELLDTLRCHFDVLPDASLNIEGDPRELPKSYLHALADMGFRRLSLGVQEFDQTVQETIGRIQPPELVERVVSDARTVGFERINFDLIYGLPYQSEDTTEQTLEHLRQMQPDSLSVFGYAHVPWMMKNQRLIPEDALPSPAERVALFLQLARGLEDAGYQPIGLDHFAAPGHPLLKGLKEGRLHRNFQGYTLNPDMEVLAFGVSAISQFRDAYAQNVKNFRSYYEAIDEGHLPIHRGINLTAEDQRRRFIINRLMCDLDVQKDTVEPAPPRPFDLHFKLALERLEPLARDGLIGLMKDRITVSPSGRLFIRHIASAFDAYLQRGTPTSEEPARQHASSL